MSVRDYGDMLADASAEGLDHDDCEAHAGSGIPIRDLVEDEDSSTDNFHDDDDNRND